MAKVSRLAGAILTETEGKYFLVGNLKQPCDFPAAGFESPGEIEPLENPYVELKPTREIILEEPCFIVLREGEDLAQMVTQRFMIERNGSISERLWDLVEENSKKEGNNIQCHWLGEVPDLVWQVVRDSVLRCL